MAGPTEYAGLETARERQARLIALAQAQRTSAGGPRSRRSPSARWRRRLGRVSRGARSLASDLLAHQPARVDFSECCGRLVRCTGVGVCTDGAVRP